MPPLAEWNAGHTHQDRAIDTDARPQPFARQAQPYTVPRIPVKRQGALLAHTRPRRVRRCALVTIGTAFLLGIVPNLHDILCNEPEVERAPTQARPFTSAGFDET